MIGERRPETSIRSARRRVATRPAARWAAELVIGLMLALTVATGINDAVGYLGCRYSPILGAHDLRSPLQLAEHVGLDLRAGGR
jgi:hypothetical protein